MSSDFLEDVESGDNSVLLEMKYNGHGVLTVLDKHGSVADYPLSPDPKGVEDAEKIIQALKAWSKQVQRIKPENFND